MFGPNGETQTEVLGERLKRARLDTVDASMVDIIDRAEHYKDEAERAAAHINLLEARMERLKEEHSNAMERLKEEQNSERAETWDVYRLLDQHHFKPTNNFAAAAEEALHAGEPILLQARCSRKYSFEIADGPCDPYDSFEVRIEFVEDTEEEEEHEEEKEEGVTKPYLKYFYEYRFLRKDGAVAASEWEDNREHLENLVHDQGNIGQELTVSSILFNLKHVLDGAVLTIVEDGREA